LTNLDQLGEQFSVSGSSVRGVFARWFDDLWASIADDYLIHSRNDANEKALNRIMTELEASEAEGHQRTA
jgi:hypothetical protein